MTRLGSLLLHGWRFGALLGHHSGVRSLFDREANGVLRYHSVGGGLYDNVSPARFRREIEYLDERFEIVDLPDVLGSSDPRRIALTFDDGYRDFLYNALPILREYDAPATVFVIADAVDDPSFAHNEKFDYSYLNRDELESLVRTDLVTVGNHTRTHPKLPGLSSDQLEREIVGAKRHLESTLGIDVQRFCYPYGRFDDRAVDIVRESHDVGVGGRGRRETISPETDPAYVPRVDGSNPMYETLWDLSPPATFLGSIADRLLESNPVPQPDSANRPDPSTVPETSRNRLPNRPR